MSESWPDKDTRGLAFGLSESLPRSLWILCLPLGPRVVCILATLLVVLLSFALLAIPPRGAAVIMVALRFALLLCCRGLPPVELVDLSKLIAAMAEPLLSCLACTVRASSRLSEQQNSHAWTSRDRPRVRRGGSGPLLGGGKELVSIEMGGSVTADVL